MRTAMQMIRVLPCFVCLALAACDSGVEDTKAPPASLEPAATQAQVQAQAQNPFEAGQVYASQREGGGYGVTKVLVADDFAVHVRMYADQFETLPDQVDTSKLSIAIGHAPMDPAGFALDKPQLIGKEAVSESELEGYKLYLDAMAGR